MSQEYKQSEYIEASQKRKKTTEKTDEIPPENKLA